MKKICIITLGFMLLAAPVLGDEVDEGLPATASMQIRLSAKQMVQAGIPGGEAVKMTRRMMENRFQEEQLIRAHRTVMAALKDDLPEKPVMDKAYEGMVKNVPPEMILQAMDKILSRYAYAYRMANAIAPQQRQVRAIGNAIAEGLSAGITESDVGRITEQLRTRAQQRTENRSEALAMETFLATRVMARLGVSGKAATDVVCQALEHRFNEQEMNMLQHSFRNGSLQTDPEKLARQYAEAIGRGERGRGLESNMQGGRSGGGGMSGSQGSAGSESSGGPGDSGGSGGGSAGGSGGSGGK